MNKMKMPLAVFIVIALLIPISSMNHTVENELPEVEFVTRRDTIGGTMEDIDLVSGSHHFTMNVGQIGNEAVRYYTTGSRISTGFREDGLTIAVSNGEIGYAYMMDFVNGRSPGPEGEKVMEFSSNYFIGSDPDGWFTDVKSFRSLYYRNVWDNIDIRYRTVDGRLKYDIFIHPGGEVENIRFLFRGVDPGEEDGNLVLETEAGSVMDDRPITMQSNNFIPSEWKINSDGTVGFEVGDHEPDQTLVIDPGFRYSSYAGGSSLDRTRDMRVDSSGYMYITGYTASSGFPTTSGSYDTGFNGGSNGDAFVMKVNISGDRLIYSTYLGGSGNDYGMGIDIDSSGNAYMAGQSYSNNYPTSNGYDTAYSNSGDAVVTKLNANGNSLTYSTYLGGWAEDSANDIRVNSAGNAFVTGFTDFVQNNWPQQWRYPVTNEAFDTTHNGNFDLFVTKLNSNGRGLSYSTLIGHSGNDRGYSIDIDSSGYAYVTGITSSSSFPTTSGAYDRTYNSGTDSIVLKLDTTGTSLSYSTFIGGSSTDTANQILVDASNRVYLTGQTGSSNFPTTTDAYDTTYGGSNDAFITLLASDGGSLVNSTFLGGSSSDEGWGLFLDGDDNLFITGQTGSTNFPTTSDANKRTNSGGDDVFVTKMDIGGSGMNYSTFIGGSNTDDGRGVHVDTSGFIYIAGTTNSNNFPTSFVAFDRTHNSNDDVFFLKFYPADFAPTNLATRSGYFWVNLTWDPPTTPIVGTHGITGYRIYRGITQTSLVPIATITSGAQYNDTINFFTSRTYYYFVTTILNTIGEGSESNMVSGIPQVTPGPLDPIPLPGDMHVNLTWSTLDQAFLDKFEVDYTVFKGITPSFMTEVSRVGEQGWYNDTDVAPRPATYYYQISYRIMGVGESNRTNLVPASPLTPPGEPQNLILTPMDLEMNLTWEEPSEDGGYPVTDYRIFRGSTPDLMGLVTVLNGSTFTYFDDDILAGRNYFYWVTAGNRLGSSVEPDAVEGMGQTVPSTPEDLRTVPGNQRIRVEWTPPQFQWGTPITGYSVYRGSSMDQLNLYKEVAGSQLNILDIVPNGVAYYYAVSASNEHGESDPTDTLEAIATGVPGVVENITLSIGNEMISLAWEKVREDGGLPIRSYKVHRGKDLESIDTTYVLSSEARTFTDTGLTNGNTYYYRITALNAKGEGAYSSAIIATPGRVASRITDISVSGELEAARLAWTVPEDLGGREGLNIQVYRGNSPSSVSPYEMIPFSNEGKVDKGLEPGVIYYYALTVINTFGESSLSPIVSTMIFGAPSQPIIQSVVSSSRMVNISWAPPEDDGGKTLGEYLVEIKPEGDTIWDTRSTDGLFYTFTGLSLGSTYDIRIAATNSLTEGRPTQAVKVLIGDPPEEPRNLRADPLNPEIRLSWDPRPSIHLSLAVMGYKIYMQIDDGEPFLWNEVSSEIEEIMVDGLIKGRNYSFGISAYNLIGEGPVTQFKKVFLSSLSEPVPWAWVESSGSEFVEISWTAPIFTGGEDIVSYTIFRGAAPTNTDVLITGVTELGYTDRTVINGRTYYYRIKAHNTNEGGSIFSPSVMARPAGTPSIPMAFDAEPTTDRVELTWAHPEMDGGDQITGYLIYKGGSAEDLDLYAHLSANTTSFTDRDVSPGGVTYRIVATNSNGIGRSVDLEVDVPSRFGLAALVGGTGLLLPIIIILLIILLPSYLKKRKEAQDRKKKEEEEEEKRIRMMRAESLASRGLPGMSSVQRPGIAPPMTTPNLPPLKNAEECVKCDDDSGYIRPKDMKKNVKDKKKILRADGKSLEHRMDEEDKRHSLKVKDHHKGKHWEEEKNKVLKEEAKKVFTGQQLDEPAPAPAPAPAPYPIEPPTEEEIDDGVVPTVDSVLNEVPVWGEDVDQEDDVPTWGENEIDTSETPAPEPPSMDDEDIEEIEDIEELDELEDLEELDEMD